MAHHFTFKKPAHGRTILEVKRFADLRDTEALIQDQAGTISFELSSQSMSRTHLNTHVWIIGHRSEAYPKSVNHCKRYESILTVQCSALGLQRVEDHPKTQETKMLRHTT